MRLSGEIPLRNEKVSVVITSWNRKEDVGKVLESVYSQSYSNVEVIIVDNSSTDGTAEMIREKFGEVKLIVMPDSSYGACETFNIGFANATGQYIAILDDDVILPTDWMLKIIEKFEAEPKNTGLIATKILDPIGVNWPHKGRENKEFYCGNFVAAGAIVKSEALRKTRGFAEEYFIYWNEEEFAAQLMAKGFNVKYFPGTVTYHKAAPTQRVSKRRFYFEVRNRIWTYAMHEPTGKSIRKIVDHLRHYWPLSTQYGYPLIYVKATIDAIKGMPNCRKRREVVLSPYWEIKG